MDISTYTYPFDIKAINVWCQWIRDTENLAHGMSPDFVLPFLEMERNRDQALLITAIQDGRCTLAIVVVPYGTQILHPRNWEVFSHNFLDVNGYLSLDTQYSYDDLFNLVEKALASRQINLSRLSVFNMQGLGIGKKPVNRIRVVPNAYFNLSKDQKYSIPGRLKRNNRRLFNKLTKQYGVTRLAADAANLDHITLFFDIEASGWKGFMKSAVRFNKQMYRAFLNSVSNKTLSKRFRVYTFYAGSRAIACAYGYESKEFISLIKIAYEQRYSEYSPGSLLFECLIDYGQKHGKSALYLSTYPKWAERWKPNLTNKECVHVYASRRLARFRYYFDQIRGYLHQIAKRYLNRVLNYENRIVDNYPNI